MPGLVLLYVGGVLFINGLSMLGKIAPKEAAVMNLLSGGLSLFVCLSELDRSDKASVQAAAFGLLFSFTYMWVAYVHLTSQYARGLGWFSLFVSATGVAGVWLPACCVARSVLWLCFFAIGVFRRPSWTRPIAWLAIVQSVSTAWLPGYLMLTGRLVA